MTTYAPEGQSSFNNVPISDSGANIPQQIKEVDRNQKFKLFECLQALVKGRLPTNDQIDNFLAMAQSSTALESRAHMLSADGQSLYKDFQELMRTTRGIVYEKNEQELFQNFIYHCTQASDSVGAQNVQAPDMSVGVNSRTAKKEGKDTLDSMVAVAKLVTTNAEFRAIIQELFMLAKEIFSDGTEKVAQTANMASEKLSAKTNVISANATDSVQTGGSKLQDGIQKATDMVQNLLGSAQEDPINTARETREDIADQSNASKDYAQMRAADMRQHLAQQTGEFKARAQAQATQAQEDAKVYANSKMPAEKRHALIERLKTVVGQIQADPQYQNAINAIMNLVGTWRQRAQKPTDSITTEANRVIQDPNVEAAILEFQVILQRWAQGYSLDPIIALIQNIWTKTKVDPELNQFANNLSTFISRAVREPNYVTSQYINADAEALIDYGRALLSAKYKSDTEAVLNEGQIFFEKLNNDPKAKEVAANFQKFAKHLFYDSRGKLKFKPHLFDDFRYVVMPAMFESFQFIPIPRIEYSDMKVDLMFDNMILTSTDLLPRLIEVNMNNQFRMVPRGANKNDRSKDVSKHEFNMIINGLEANIRDVDYFVRTKEGFKFKDHGIADILISKKGMDIKVMGRKTPETVETPSLIAIDSVKVKINALAIKMRNSEHPALYALARPFIKAAVKKAVANALETQIKEALTSGDKALATSIRDTRIKTGKNTFGALVDSATSFVTSKVNPDAKTKAENERKTNQGHYDRTSRVIFDEDGLCVLDPIKHMELKVGQPLHEDPNAMAAMPVAAPWVSTAFDMTDMHIKGQQQQQLPGMRRTHGSLAM
ncbi:hypothetical protein K457DRAFT_120648 [Linnemannia elongata AG-77]|uniref:Uncharacterized protein n=1 Tax=Linnemannia elongata AG-77 TaxID=1314771 RepID=A0A197KDV4_9FUNG|nr:hypothetical protein K457DRAFT_120648 [Linnemannia elongata AG-77]